MRLEIKAILGNILLYLNKKVIYAHYEFRFIIIIKPHKRKHVLFLHSESEKQLYFGLNKTIYFDETIIIEILHLSHINKR